ncbi:MAG TPA: hypothetical protein VM140_14270 [Burkholderiales bacterium]|nr:hypothetical protein [Burkholderiales bacterium]
MICLAATTAARGALMGEPISNFEGMPIKTLGAAPSADQVREAIIAAGEKREWTFVDAGPGALVGTLTVRMKHTAEVGITYGPQSYSVVYRRSTNLNYRADGPSIHPNYNKWVRDLVNGIDLSLASIRGESSAPVAATPPSRRSSSAEVSFWESVRNSKNPEELQAYLDLYPNGSFAALARSRLAALGAPAR